MHRNASPREKEVMTVKEFVDFLTPFLESHGDKEVFADPAFTQDPHLCCNIYRSKDDFYIATLSIQERMIQIETDEIAKKNYWITYVKKLNQKT